MMSNPPRWRWNRLSASLFVTIITAALVALPASAAVSVLTQHNDIGRTGANLQEKTITTTNVKVGTFGKLFGMKVEGLITAQPLYAAQVDVLHTGKLRNVLYIATSHNRVYAFDADGGNSNMPYWSRNLGAYVPSQTIPTNNLLSGIGIVSTPVIDPAKGLLYACYKIYDKTTNTQTYQVAALDILTGKTKIGPVNIVASVQGGGNDNIGGVVYFGAEHQLNRPALLLLNGNIYLAFGSHEDRQPYHGWILSYNATTLQQTGVYCTTANGYMGAIWQGGQGLASDGTSVYFETGNGDTNVQNGGTSVSECFGRVQLTSPGSLQLKDWFLVHNYQSLNDADLDLGSAGPIIVPQSKWLLGCGKEGVVYVTKQNALGQWGGSIDSDPQIQQEFNAYYGNMLGSPVIWPSKTNGLRFYVWSTGDVLRCYQFNPVTSKFNTTPFATGGIGNPSGIAAPAALSLSANGDTPGSGIVWTTAPSQDADPNQAAGTLYAYDASNANLIYASNQAAADSIGNWAKFAPPTIANGKVYVASASGQVYAFGLISKAPTTPAGLTTVSGNGKVNISWSSSKYAATYDLLRSTTQTGTYSVVAQDQTGTNFIDYGVSNGTAYYYEVVAKNSKGTSVASAPVVANPSSSSTAGNVISIDFVGGGSNSFPHSMSPSEVAGVVPAAAWNNAQYNTSSVNSLLDNSNFPTTANLGWYCTYEWSFPFTDTPGNYRLMAGYLNPDQYGSAYISVSSIPSDFVAKGYSVYVYCQGATNENHQATYTLNSTTITASDPANSTFTGTFTKALAGSNGNYVLFTGLTASSFNLTATPVTSVGTDPRAPVNGIQIVRNP